MKIAQRHLSVILIVLLVVLVGYGALRTWTPFRLPGSLDSELPNLVIVGALAVFFYGRKLRSDAAKAKEAEQRAAEEERAASENAARDEADGSGGR